MLYVCYYALGLYSADFIYSSNGRKIWILRKILVRAPAERHSVNVYCICIQRAVTQRPRVLGKHFSDLFNQFVIERRRPDTFAGHRQPALGTYDAGGAVVILGIGFYDRLQIYRGIHSVCQKIGLIFKRHLVEKFIPVFVIVILSTEHCQSHSVILSVLMLFLLGIFGYSLLPLQIGKHLIRYRNDYFGLGKSTRPVASRNVSYGSIAALVLIENCRNL